MLGWLRRMVWFKYRDTYARPIGEERGFSYKREIDEEVLRRTVGYDANNKPILSKFNSGDIVTTSSVRCNMVVEKCYRDSSNIYVTCTYEDEYGIVRQTLPQDMLELVKESKI